jgi:spermidine synthase
VEASNNANDMRLERLLGHLSTLAHPNPESVLVVGSARASPPARSRSTPR